MEWIRNWLCGVCAAAILLAIMKELAPKNFAGHCVKMTASLILILAVLSPLRNEKISGLWAESQWIAPELPQQEQRLTQTNENLELSIIEEKLSAYIWEQARDLGISCRVSVHAGKGGDGNWRPESVEIALDHAIPEAKKQQLSERIEQQCAIPKSAHYFLRQEG